MARRVGLELHRLHIQQAIQEVENQPRLPEWNLHAGHLQLGQAKLEQGVLVLWFVVIGQGLADDLSEFEGIAVPEDAAAVDGN